MRSIDASVPPEGMQHPAEFPNVERILSVADQTIGFAV